MASKQKKNDATIAPMNIQRARITLIGDSPLIVHAWSAKARGEILDKQMKKAKGAKQPKDPEALFQEALYRMPGEQDHYGFPATGIKSSAVDACSLVNDMTKVEARGAFHVIGDMIPLEYDELRARKDMVRISISTADVRIRPEFIGWKITFEVRYNTGVISLDQLATLFNVGGFGIGIGEWRPQKDGNHGMFHVGEAVAITE